MDRVFLEYYEEELLHIRAMATEFAEMHPSVARNLSLDTVPCPDPYVERLLEGVAYLAARTRLKVDAERSRFARSVLDVLYPDLIAPTPACAIAIFKPGKQVQTMAAGHLVKCGTQLLSSLRPGMSTRCTFTTVQDVTLWPIEIAGASYIQDQSALAAAGLPARAGVESALRIGIARSGKGMLSELSIDQIDLHFGGRAKAPLLFDAIFGACDAVVARAEGEGGRQEMLSGPDMIGIADSEAMLPRTRSSFEGYRLLREYFIMPERFHFARLRGLRQVVRHCTAGLEVFFLLKRPAPELADLVARELELFATPIVNLFERECNVVEIDPRRTRQVLHADRTRPRDFEIYRPVRVENADVDGPEAEVPALFGLRQNRGSGTVYSVERRPRRPTEDERRQGTTRTSYVGDDVFLAVSRPAGMRNGALPKRLDVVALCTNRDLPILDDNPTLSLDSGDPVDGVKLIGAVRSPQPAIAPRLPTGPDAESRADDLAWRLVSQLSLNFLSLASEGRGADALKALLDLYADRGDPALARHARSIEWMDSKAVVERLAIAGPMCFGRGTEITLHVDESVLAGHSTLLLSALLSRLFARHAGINGFVRTKTRLLRRQEEVPWPMTPGNRYLI